MGDRGGAEMIDVGLPPYERRPCAVFIELAPAVVKLPAKTITLPLAVTDGRIPISLNPLAEVDTRAQPDTLLATAAHAR